VPVVFFLNCFPATAQAQAFAVNLPFGVFSFAGSSALAG
jgi:hypothetical protein